jgi:GNAT superfamily N-acetyltransferase
MTDSAPIPACWESSSGRSSPTRVQRKRWKTDSYISADVSAVAVVREDGTVVGVVTWTPCGLPSGVGYEIGVGIVPEHRGQGFGTAAQDLLVEYLLDRTWRHRMNGACRRSPARRPRRIAPACGSWGWTAAPTAVMRVQSSGRQSPAGYTYLVISATVKP